MLPPRAFVDPGVFEWELEQIFRAWVCVGHLSRGSEPGEDMMREVGTDSVGDMSGEDGRPHAFLNVCRHRGARLLWDFVGGVRGRLVCPYSAWAYGRFGGLAPACRLPG